MPLAQPPPMNIALIGAGPVGSYAAYLLSKKGFKVHLFDQKKPEQIGRPIQCTGLLTSELTKFLPLDSSFLTNILTNTFSQIEVSSPHHQKITLNKTEYLVDRPKFDQHFLALALKQGTIFYPQHKLTGIKKNQKQKYNLIFQTKNKLKIISPDIIIGADGPLSLVYQYLNPDKKRTFYYGLQALIKGSFNPSAYQTFFGNKICPQLFAWLVPESKTRARIGLATLKNPAYHFTKLLRQNDIRPAQIIEKQAGLIPLFNPRIRTCRQNIFLLGDAAGYVKATTLGGIIPGFKEAVNLTYRLTNRKPPFHNQKNLQLHLKLRNLLNKFSDQDYNRLIRLLNQPKNRQILETSSRESPQKLLRKLLLNEPRLLSFAKHLFLAIYTKRN